MACNSLIATARACGKYTNGGINQDVYLIAFSDLAPVSGSTNVYSTSVSGLISAISFVTASTKYVKYGAVVDQSSIKEDYTFNANGTFDIQKSLSFTLTNVGDVATKTAVENLIANPVSALVKLKNGSWIAFGLNGGFMAKTVAGTVDNGSNSRVITLGGSDTELIQVVDPTIISGLLS